MSCGGLRNFIYESHCFGTTLVLDPNEFNIEDPAESERPDFCADIETVILTPNDGRSSGTIYIEFVEDPDGSQQFNGTPNSSKVPDSHTDHRWFPRRPEADGPGPHFAVVSCDGDLPWVDVFDSINEPTPGWQICHTTGVFEITPSKSRIPTLQPLTIPIIVTNLDTQPATFVFRDIELRGTSSGEPFTCFVDNPDDEVDLPVNHGDKGSVAIDLVFSDVPEFIDRYDVHYPRPTRTVIIASSEPGEPAPGRPRINPGG